MSTEWSVLEAIHPTICVANENAIVSLRVPVELAGDTPLRVFPVPHDAYLASPSLPAPAPADPDPPDAALSVLPPLLLRIALPPTYPAHDPPAIESLHVTSAWLPPPVLPLLEQRMTAMWHPGDDSGVLYTWVEWIRTGEFLADIGFLADNGHIQIPHPSPQLLLAPLLAYAASSKSAEFALASYLCAICLSVRKGAHCIALSCTHVFCRPCLTDMWGLHIKEGQVSQVACPEPSCGKSDTQDANGLREATEDEIRAVLSESQLDRWKWLRRNRDLERDPTMIHCPMEYCQEPVTKPKSDSNLGEEESGWERLRTCTACNYSFCAFCKRTWHGPHTLCPVSLSSQFLLDYLAAPPDSRERHAIERRFGRNTVLKLVRQHEEEQQNRNWIDSSTTACPGCEIKVEKSGGCNHMTCAKCKTHFCYRCGATLSAADPYEHFSIRHTPCFARLFDYYPGLGAEGEE